MLARLPYLLLVQPKMLLVNSSLSERGFFELLPKSRKMSEFILTMNSFVTTSALFSKKAFILSDVLGSIVAS